MRVVQMSKQGIAGLVAALVVCVPVIADVIQGQIKSIDGATQTMVVHDEKTKTDITVSLAVVGKSKALGKGRNVDLKDLKVGSRVVVDSAIVASHVEIAEAESKEIGTPPSLLA